MFGSDPDFPGFEQFGALPESAADGSRCEPVPGKVSTAKFPDAIALYPRAAHSEQFDCSADQGQVGVPEAVSVKPG